MVREPKNGHYYRYASGDSSFVCLFWGGVTSRKVTRVVIDYVSGDLDLWIDAERYGYLFANFYELTPIEVVLAGTVKVVETK